MWLLSLHFLSSTFFTFVKSFTPSSVTFSFLHHFTKIPKNDFVTFVCFSAVCLYLFSLRYFLDTILLWYFSYYGKLESFIIFDLHFPLTIFILGEEKNKVMFIVFLTSVITVYSLNFPKSVLFLALSLSYLTHIHQSLLSQFFHIKKGRKCLRNWYEISSKMCCWVNQA